MTSSQHGLRGCRSIRPSPFADLVLYFCGFDPTGVRGASATGPTAWIDKGNLKSEP